MCIRTTEDGITVEIKVQPRSSKTGIGPISAGAVKVRISEAPVDGKANEAVIKLFSSLLGIAKSQIRIIKGELARSKVIAISGVSTSDLEKIIK
ncbi:YggU family protein [Myxococcota bacterium]|nr:YggU family protein [Myxococcota bacterium]MBU1381702.1 YggU family protein [Myxococcota bacterium]MBU1497490.1 YggU family protein [Myxococcota bacterium]